MPSGKNSFEKEVAASRTVSVKESMKIDTNNMFIGFVFGGGGSREILGEREWHDVN